MFSILFMIAGIGLLAWHHAVWHGREPAVGAARARSARGPDDHAVDARDREVLLARRRALPRPDPARRDDRALPGRGTECVRLPARRRSALQPDAQLAHAARGALDRDRLARHGPVHRTGDLGARAAVPAPGRQLPVDLPDRDRRRRVRGPMVRGHAEARAREQLLVRPPGLGIRRHRPLLADLPVHRTHPVARARRTRAVAGAQAPRRHLVDRRAPVPVDGRDRASLRRRAHVARAHAPLARRVLALVGRAPVGRGLLRGVRDRGHQLHLRQAGPRARPHGDHQRAVRHDRLHGGRRARHVPSPVLRRHDRRGRRARRELLGARGGSARPHRARGVRHLAAQPGDAVDGSATAGRSSSSSR